MQQSLWTTLSALQSSLSWLNRASNNIANQNTPGFAADTGSFADTLTQALSGRATALGNANRYTPPGWWGGTGVAALKNGKDFSQMPVKPTGNPTDLALQGNGFFVVQGDNGQTQLTKAGNFTWSQQANGSFVLATPAGQAVLDVNGKPITAPATAGGAAAQSFTVGPEGQVSFGKPSGQGQTGQKIAIADVFLAAENLTSVGNNSYVAGAGAQPVIVNRTATTVNSSIVQGALSMSNVDVTVSLTDLIQAQNMFTLNSEAFQLTNRMMGDANTIRK